MQPLQQELDWEKEMLDRGIRRYQEQQASAIRGDRAAETSAGARLLSSYIEQVSGHIKDYLDGKLETRRAPNAKVLDGMDPDKIAFIGIKRMLSCVFVPDTLVSATACAIGKRIEDEYNFMRLEAEHKQYHDTIMRALEDRRTSNYEYKRKSIIQSYRNAKDVEVIYWTQQQRAVVGLIILQLIRASTDLFEIEVSHRADSSKRGQTKMLRPTESCRAWVLEHDDAMAMLLPDRMPMLTEPADWVAPDDGGYYLPELRMITPLVITDKYNPQKRMKMYKRAQMPQVLSAINWMQRTGWRVNSRVLDTMREIWEKSLETGMPRTTPYEFPACPIDKSVDPSTLGDTPDGVAFKMWKEETRFLHIKETERKALCMMVSRNIRLAAEMEQHNEFYYVYRCDFRGRVYAATTGLSPQGADQGKGVLQFAVGKPIGERGLYWLKVHGANKWGNDKCSYDARVAWIESRHDEWLAVDADPLGTRSIWGEADKPYQFLAFCFEYAAASRIGAEFRSHLPIALDGTCNGLQHFSAMLRDQVGGSAVNLVPGDVPADIYQDVGDVATKKLLVLADSSTIENAAARNWLRLFRKLNGDNVRMPRKLPKPPVMTLPYGSSQRTCTQTCYDWYMKYGKDYFGKNMGFRHAVYITPVIWGSIGEVVIAARSVMGWLQKCAGTLAKEGYPVHYVTPLGFPVHQQAFVRVERFVETAIDGSLRIRIFEDTQKLDTRRMRQQISPNFVHSMDATHMMMVINAAAERGVDSFAMIHDDFGCHACHIDDYNKVIRETFVALYTSSDVLAEFRQQHVDVCPVDLPPPPSPGDLDIAKVLESKYFFG